MTNDKEMQGFTTVPFKTESAHGLKTVNGIAKFSSAGIVLEFEAKLFGIIGGGVQEVRLPKDEVLDIKFHKGLFKRGAKIVVRTKTFTKLAELPNQDGKLTLKLERDDFDRGQSAVELLQKELAEYTHALPPQQTSIREIFQEEEPDDETRQLAGKEDRE